MKFYEFIEYLQRENPNKVVMVSNGVFFNAIGRDAIILERVLGFKRTCHARFLCKCGMPVSYVRENIEKVKKRLMEKGISVVIYDEFEEGRYKFKDKKYDILLEIEGEDVKESRRNLDCFNCENNKYRKDINKYVIEKENYDEIMNKIVNKIDNIINEKSKLR